MSEAPNARQTRIKITPQERRMLKTAAKRIAMADLVVTLILTAFCAVFLSVSMTAMIVLRVVVFVGLFLIAIWGAARVLAQRAKANQPNPPAAG